VNGAPTPPDPQPALRVPLHQQVQDAGDRLDLLEAALNALIERHNKLAADMSYELGL
jgi:hypothetical protein